MTDDMTRELDEPTPDEAAAEAQLHALILELCGDPAQAEFHLWSCRRRSLNRGKTSRFFHYLVYLSAELPLLMTEPESCRSAFTMQKMINDAKQAVAESEEV